ncbi:MAG: hypothetical protein PF505_13890 [Vallitaleaceae bacterium]|nr:hypothetical protein [Vallitaleaceae bacterium]
MLIFMGTLMMILIGIVLFSSVISFQKPIPIGFYSEASGVYFVKNGSDKKIDNKSDISKEDLENAVQYYLVEDKLYELQYYDEDRLIADPVWNIYPPRNHSSSVVYTHGMDYYLYNGKDIIDLDINGSVVEGIRYLKQGEIIGLIIYENLLYQLYLYQDGEFIHIDSSEKPMDYFEWYNDKCYYLRSRGDVTAYCTYDNDNGIVILTEIEEDGIISCVTNKGISIIGSPSTGTWHVFQDDQVTATYEGYDYMSIRYATSELTVVEILDRQDSKMLIIYQDGKIEEASSLANIPINLSSYISDDGLRRITLESRELVKYTYFDADTKEDQVLFHDISDFTNIRFDDEIEHIYFIDGTNTLLSMDLVSSEVEIIQEGVVGYYVMNNGIIYGTRVDRSVYYKENGVQPVKIIDTLEETGLVFVVYVISYDGEHAYIQDGISSSSSGTVYFFDTDKYYVKLIDTDTNMYYMDYDAMMEATWQISFGEFSPGE